jgi:hypothetical protein
VVPWYSVVHTPVGHYFPLKLYTSPATTIGTDFVLGGGGAISQVKLLLVYKLLGGAKAPPLPPLPGCYGPASHLHTLYPSYPTPVKTI